MHKFEKKVFDTIKKYNMLKNGEKVLVAFSGGADSTALVCVLKSLGFAVCAAHINHCLRGADADSDQEFVQHFCEKNGIECYVKKVSVKKYAEQNHLSCEEAGRVIRYEFFNEIAAKNDICKIAVAHNKSDSVETSIFNFIRGASSGGLKGILPVNGNIVRPLIECAREEIEEYLSFKNTSFVTDKTNFENEYSRNRIRNIIIKDMEKINPSVINTVFENSKIIAEENDFIFRYVQNKARECVNICDNEVFLNLSKIKNEHIIVKKRLVVYCAQKLISDFRTSAKNINAIAHLRHGKKIILVNYGLTISNNYDILQFKVDFLKKSIADVQENSISSKKSGFMYQIFDGKSISVKKIFDEINIKFNVSFVKFDEISDFKSAVYICVDSVNEPIYIRSRKDGDKISIASVGRRKIKDIFIDRKIHRELRDKIPIIATSSTVLAIYGITTDKKYFADDKSGRILMIKTFI